MWLGRDRDSKQKALNFKWTNTIKILGVNPEKPAILPNQIIILTKQFTITLK